MPVATQITQQKPNEHATLKRNLQPANIATKGRLSEWVPWLLIDLLTVFEPCSVGCEEMADLFLQVINKQAALRSSASFLQTSNPHRLGEEIIYTLPHKHKQGVRLHFAHPNALVTWASMLFHIRFSRMTFKCIIEPCIRDFRRKK